MSERTAYAPAPGTIAFRALAHLETLPAGAELMTSALADAIGAEALNVAPCLEAPLRYGLIHRRQRDNHARSPYWWSLTDHSRAPKADIRRPAVPTIGVDPQPQPQPQCLAVAEPEQAQRAARKANGKAQPEAAAAPPFRCALWSNGVLQIDRTTVGGAAEHVLLSPDETRELVLLSPDETRELVRYLDRLRVEEAA